MRVLYLTCALLLILAGPGVAQTPQAATPAQPAAAAAGATTGYTVFVRGNPVGREDVSIDADASGVTIESQGRLSAPFNAVLRSAVMRYRRDWTPESFTLDATVNGADTKARTTFADGVATIEGTQGTAPVKATVKVSDKAFVLPNGIFGAFAALSRRLAATGPQAELPVFIFPTGEISARIVMVHEERMQTGTQVFSVRRYEMSFPNGGAGLAVNLTATEDGTLVRVSIPAQGLDVVREDVAASTGRSQVFSNEGDEAVIIPSAGFNIGATLTRPKNAAAGTRLPAVILLSDAGASDRDGGGLGVPVAAQLAGGLAERGFLSVRFDKRGYGQSGGRAESATLSDAAEDARAIVKWLSDRKDIDPKRIAVAGHGEGAAVAMLAAARDKKIAAVITIGAPAASGADAMLDQQQRALDQMKLPAAEREAKVAQQKQIQSAVLTGRGWDGIPPALRQQADTPWFQSVLAFDPAKTIDDVRQPLLIVHGELDRDVPASQADRLATMAREEGKSKVIDVVIVRGVNHLLVPQSTGGNAEFAGFSERTINPEVATAIANFLDKTTRSAK